MREAMLKAIIKWLETASEKEISLVYYYIFR